MRVPADQAAAKRVGYYVTFVTSGVVTVYVLAPAFTWLFTFMPRTSLPGLDARACRPGRSQSCRILSYLCNIGCSYSIRTSTRFHMALHLHASHLLAGAGCACLPTGRSQACRSR